AFQISQTLQANPISAGPPFAKPSATAAAQPPPPLLMADPSPSPPTAASASDALLAPDATLPAAAPDLDKEFGFQRAELGKEKLAGTVGFHERHVFLCYKGPEEWPSHVEASESDHLPRLLAAAIKARKPNLKKSTKLTICEGEDGTESSLGDVLIFPDMIRYRELTHLDVDNFVEEVLLKDTEWLPGSPEAIKGSYVFVCCHGSRDKRCGVCGPALITRFKEEIEGQGLDGQVAVSACSHVGGHKYAGNVIIFSPDAKGEVTGHWYGYVAPDDVPVLLRQHIGQGEIVGHLWSGY
uniref:Sucraseferredoxin-like protein n=1 Tax=Aegilops tauschii subsp. strangulata TaxID=200361 RepID=A0A452YTV6_AEGTS